MVSTNGCSASRCHQNSRCYKKIPLSKAKGLRHAYPILSAEKIVTRQKTTATASDSYGLKHVECPIYQSIASNTISINALTAIVNE